jgi:hypothetical protein
MQGTGQYSCALLLKILPTSNTLASIMKLLSSQTLELHDFLDYEFKRPEFAILSHTWIEKEEVSHQDLHCPNKEYKKKKGYKKIEGCCQQARKDGIDWVWVDTCCIDKSSSAELAEAINSMFRWYADAKVCYAYLSDVPGRLPVSSEELKFVLKQSLWFKRGWTLQELLAPKRFIIYSQNWSEIGSREQWSSEISSITGIHEKALQGDIEKVREFSIAQRMFWASTRITTRPEDIAYCLLGIFDVNMPLLYGEGSRKAFIRLQEEIMKDSDDHTIFAWASPSIAPDALVGLLAGHPKLFRHSKDICSFRRWNTSLPFSMTNKGLKIAGTVDRDKEVDKTWLDCFHTRDNRRIPMGILLRKLFENGDQYARQGGQLHEYPVHPTDCEEPLNLPSIYIRKEIIRPHPSLKNDPYRIRSFLLLQKPSSHELTGHFGAAEQNSNTNKFEAPPINTWSWIHVDDWKSWRVVCWFESVKDDRGAFRSLTKYPHPDFGVILGCNHDNPRPWCAIKGSGPELLSEIWETVRNGEESICKRKIGGVEVAVKMTINENQANTIDVSVSCTPIPE